MSRNKFLKIGKVVGVHGVRGEIKIESWCDSPEDFCEISKMLFNPESEPFKIEGMRIHKNNVLLKISGVDNREEAEDLRGKIIYAKRSDIPLEQGRYFIEDLKGCRVIDDISNKEYGILKEVWNTGANDIYTIKDNKNKEYYLPVIEGTIRKVDLDNNEIFINPLEGVFDEN